MVDALGGRDVFQRHLGDLLDRLGDQLTGRRLLMQHGADLLNKAHHLAGALIDLRHGVAGVVGSLAYRAHAVGAGVHSLDRAGCSLLD